VNPSPWKCALELDEHRNVTGGSPVALVDAIRRGADLRIGTTFRHNEHIDTSSDCPELIREVAEFGATYVVDDRWAAGIMTLRQPIELPVGFGPRPSMSFFLYNQDGQQAIARPFLDGAECSSVTGRSPDEPPENMPRYHVLDTWDSGTNAPCHNFIFDFGVFRYMIRDDWTELLSHDAEGTVLSGSLEALTEAFYNGCALKIAVNGLCDDLAGEGALPHELMVQAGPGYHYTDRQLFMVGSHPLVRVRPAVPMRYETRAWDFGWVMARTDGHVVYRRCDPYTLRFDDRIMGCAMRWFAR